MVVIEEVESPRALDYKDEGNAAFKNEEWDKAVSSYAYPLSLIILFSHLMIDFMLFSSLKY